MTVRLASSVAIQSPEATSIPDLQLTVGGVKVESPVLSTLELINDGAKPIPATDFESALELTVGQPSKIVRARISKVEPEDLKAELDTSSQVVKLKPLLLNQNDKITIAVLTSGSTPTFLPRARIAGISIVKFENTIKPEKTWRLLAANAAIATAAIVLYFIFGAAIARSSTARLTKTLSICTMLMLGMYSANSIHHFFKLAELKRDFASISTIFLLVVAIGLGVFIQAVKRFGRGETACMRVPIIQAKRAKARPLIR